MGDVLRHHAQQKCCDRIQKHDQNELSGEVGPIKWVLQPYANGFGECVLQSRLDVEFEMAIIAFLVLFVVQPIFQADFVHAMRAEARRYDQTGLAVFTQAKLTYVKHSVDHYNNFIPDYLYLEFWVFVENIVSKGH